MNICKKIFGNGVYAVLLFLVLVSCQTRRRLSEVTYQRDSLLALTQQQDSIKESIDAYIGTLVETLDSIKTQEKILTIQRKEDGQALKKDEIRNNLELFSRIIHRQRDRIQDLEAKLENYGLDSTSKYRVLISHLYQQIDEKNVQIAHLKKDLETKNVTITRLSGKVDSLKKDVQDISEQVSAHEVTIAEQTEILQEQSDMLNKAYIKVGTRKELKAAGLIGNLFQGGKLQVSSLDLSQFTPVDIREIEEIQLSSNHPRLISSHPSNSYEIKRQQVGGSVLRILDSPSFWSVSNILVIQL